MPEDTQAPGASVEGQADGTQSTGQVESTPDTDAGQANVSEGENFSSLDPNTIPEELRPFYNSMLKDYRGKTSEIADLRKKSEAYDGLMGNEQFTRFMDSVTNQNQAQEPTVPQTGEDLLVQILENPQKLDEIIEAKARQLLDPVANEVYADKAQQMITSLEQKYPDFVEHEDQIAELVESQGLDPETAYKILTYDKVKQRGVNEGIQSVQKRAEAAQPSGSTAAVVPEGRYATMHEAWEAAKRSLGQ